VIKIRKETALFTRTFPIDKLKEAINFCQENNLKLTIINRIPDFPINTIPHKQFLELLKCFDYYLDLKGLTTSDVLSRSGLEALRASCKVLVDTGEIITDFKMTSPNDYVKLYFELFESSK